MRALLPLVILLTCAFAAPAFAQDGGAKERAAVTVMPFAALEDGGQAWIGKALGDMVAQQLLSAGFEVLERDRLQAFIREMELQEAGFTSPEALSRVGALAKVDRVIYGNYAWRGKKIALHIMEMDAGTHGIVTRAAAEGETGSLPEAVEKLVAEFLKARGGRVGEGEAPRFRATDSAPAIQHFYQGMDHYDHGRYQDAYGAFLLASRQDMKYLDARLWAAKMLDYTGEREQAVAAYQKLYEDAPAAVEGRDALFFAARLLEDSDPAAAIAHYGTLAAIMPRVPESLEAAFRLAGVLEKQGKYAEAYKALKGIQDFRELAVKMVFTLAAQEYHAQRRSFFGMMHDLMRAARQKGALAADGREQVAELVDVAMRGSRFFNWEDALSLYRGAAVRMVGLYRDALAQDPQLAPPRGAFAVDPANPVIGEARFGEKKSLFFEDERYVPEWKESFYAAIVPAGYAATGVTLEVTGHVPTPSPTTDFTLRVFGFPLVKNYYNKWLGVIYGQTQGVTTLQKEIPFHGFDRDILVFQLIENRGRIKDWKVTFRLRKTEESETPAPPPARMDADFEGAVAARIPVREDPGAAAADPQYIEQYATKKRLALASRRNRGFTVVAAKGSLSAGDTDLWMSRSAGGNDWTPLAPMSVNSQSNDFAPQLVAGEDGGLRLFFISDRRGLGWELWTSALEKDGESWSQPSRIPFGQFVHYRREEKANVAGDLLEYAAMQDRQGRWFVAVAATDGAGIGILSSRDAENWEGAGAASAGARLFNPALFQDATGVYWLGAIDGRAAFLLMRSADLKKWEVKDYGLGSYSRHWSSGGSGNYGSLSQIAGFPVRLFDGDSGGLALLFADTVTGLQYAFFRPESEEPAPDLVREVTMEPYDAVKLGRASWLVAAWQGDDIVLRRYKKFAFPENEKNGASDPLYRETETAADGSRWDRRIARTRYVMPDVTAVGVAPDGRAWWGIETGVMSLKGRDFYVSDVSMGFFHHQATHIVPCGRKVYFAARSLPRPVIGVISSGWLVNKSDKIELPALAGSITALACAGDGDIYVGSTGGGVAKVSGSRALYVHRVEPGAVTALAAEGGGAVAGTSSGALYRFDEKGVAKVPFRQAENPYAVSGVAADAGGLWVATAGGGIYRGAKDGWMQFTPENSAFPYAAPGKLKAQGNGVWFLPDPYTRAQGIGFFNGKEARLYRLPSHDIFDMIDFDLAPDGAVWIGSESTGIYRMEAKK